MAKSKLDAWTEQMHVLNEERSMLVYKLLPEDKTGDWGELARIQASGHPDLVEINNRIQEHVANHPDPDADDERARQEAHDVLAQRDFSNPDLVRYQHMVANSQFADPKEARAFRAAHADHLNNAE